MSSCVYGCYKDADVGQSTTQIDLRHELGIQGLHQRTVSERRVIALLKYDVFGLIDILTDEKNEVRARRPTQDEFSTFTLLGNSV